MISCGFGALGWGVTTRRWSPGPIYNHAGTNTLNYAVVWLAPGINRAYVSSTIAANDASEVPADNAVWHLINRNDF
ncbi:MAG: hypothetical protein ACT4TC_04295 [Myxococcaceae bacterium]